MQSYTPYQKTRFPGQNTTKKLPEAAVSTLIATVEAIGLPRAPCALQREPPAALEDRGQVLVIRKDFVGVLGNKTLRACRHILPCLACGGGLVIVFALKVVDE